MGLNAFCLTVYIRLGSSRGVLISGIVFFLCGLLGVIDQIDKAIPTSMKRAVAAGIGLFIALIGLINAGIVVADPATVVALGNIKEAAPTVALLGLIITALLMALRVKGAILIGILISTVIGMFNGVTQVPQSIGDLVGARSWRKLCLSWILWEPQLGFMVIFAGFCRYV